MNQQRKRHDEDDGRVIMNMNVEGMPWHDKNATGENISSKHSVQHQSGQMTRSQSRLYTWYAVLYGLGIAAVFSVTWILFTLLLTKVVFK